MSKVYEVEGTIVLTFNFEVDAKSNMHARQIAERELSKYLVMCKKDYDESYIEIESCEESEGH